MSIAITEDHLALAETSADLLAARDAKAAARALLEAEADSLPSFWSEVAELGQLGLHLPEEHGGSGYGMEELVVFVEQLGASLAPGPFVPTVIASAVIDAAGTDEQKAALLPGLADGSTPAAVAVRSTVTVSGGTATGSASALGAGVASLIMLPAGDDVVVVSTDADGVSMTTPPNLDPTRRASKVDLDGAAVEVLPGAAGALTDLARLLFSAEAVGVARACTDMAAEYAKDRQQFGRAIAMFQGVKHHCANMLVAAEMATAAVWDAARAADEGGAQFSYAAAVAASLAGPAADQCANLNIQVHGGIGFTWEHDGHLYLRRATALALMLEAEVAATAITDLTRDGVERIRKVDLPPEAEAMRDEVREFARSIAGLEWPAQREKMIEAGYAMPHWPKPWGREAGAVEQLVIEEEFANAGLKRPQYGITGWVILTLIQYGTDEQIERWVRPALNQELIWCQLFSEPDAGSDAAGIKTKATRVDGGWLVNGQKVWTSGAHQAKWGFATVRTNPDAPKHQGVTIMVVDMESDQVEVRPLKQTTGSSEFNEVFFNDVFVPDDDVIGPVDAGWTVARATLGNESVSIGSGGGGGMLGAISAKSYVDLVDTNADRLPGAAARVGHHFAYGEAMKVINLRSAHRAVAGGEPGPEGAITKLVLSEFGHETAYLLATLNGDDALYLDGPGLAAGMTVLAHRGMSIAGGTSEIKRNQIGERILGLPRDPLLK